MTFTVDYTTPGFVHPGPSVDEQFFYDHAGWSYHPERETPEEGRWRTAQTLRKAELHGRREGWEVVWGIDPDPMWDDDVERETTDYNQFIAFLQDEDGLVLVSLGCIDLGPDNYPDLGDKTDPYVRVVEAELMHDAMIDAGLA